VEGEPLLQPVPATEIVTVQEKKVKTMNQVLVICGPPQFILERRQFWSHPSFQKHTKTTALVLKASDLTPQWQLTSG